MLSKKELLDLTGISYGQLYRWKRKDLIPEEWFIRKSTFTGQETFFPRERMLQRIEQIKSMKDELSLDEMANMFSPNPSNVSLSTEQIVSQNIVSRKSLDIYLSRNHNVQKLTFNQLLFVYVVDIALKTGDINADEGAIILQTMDQHFEKYEHGNCHLMFVRKLGVSTCVLYSGSLNFDSGAKVVFQVDVSQCIEDLKLKLV